MTERSNLKLHPVRVAKMDDVTKIARAANKSAESAENNDITSLSPMQKYFLAVLILAILNAILGAIYGMISYHTKKRRKMGPRYHGESRPVVNRVHKIAVYVGASEQKKRRMSTHIAIAMAQNKQSVRRVASSYL